MPSLCDPQGKQSKNLQTNLGKISYSGFSARLIYPMYNLNYMSYLKKGSEADIYLSLCTPSADPNPF